MSLLDGVMKALGDNVDLGSLAALMGNDGLTQIVGQLQKGGLGDVVQSWVSNGANMPVSLDQLQAVLGPDIMNKLSGVVGGDLSQVAEKLPEIINQLTPNGKIENIDLGSVMGALSGNGGLGSVLGGFLKS